MLLRVSRYLHRPFIASSSKRLRAVHTRITYTKLGQQSSQASSPSNLPTQERTMSTANVQKTEDEWRAVLSPEQVSTLDRFFFFFILVELAGVGLSLTILGLAPCYNFFLLLLLTNTL
jgi:hypothetical protein